MCIAVVFSASNEGRRWSLFVGRWSSFVIDRYGTVLLPYSKFCRFSKKLLKLFSNGKITSTF